MTEKLFYEDSHMKVFTANVLECKEEEDGYRVRLDRSAFFPEGGGQYADTGMLAGRYVLDVQEKDGVIWHYTDGPVETGTEVTGEINWQERFMKMQQHTGEHIVSGLVHARFGYTNVGFHLGSEDCTMDFDGRITRDELRQIEWKANEAVVENLDVQVAYPLKAELERLDYRSKIEIEGQVRIVTIPGYDVCACCAPHVEKTGEIGLIKLTNIQSYKGGVRVTMLCGFRALKDYGRKLSAVKRISASLCARENETAEAVEHLKEECAGLKLELAGQKRALLEYKIKEVNPEESIVCLFEDNMDADGPRFLMNRLLDAGHTMCAVFSRQTESNANWRSEKRLTEKTVPAYRYVIGSRTLDMRELVKELNREFSGRGGGKPEMVQGSLQGDEENLREWIQKKGRALENE